MEAATAQIGLLGAAAVAQALELGLQVAGLLVAGGPGALHERGLQPGDDWEKGGAPLRRRVERRLPALSSLRGQRPAQEIRWPAVGKRLMSVPISETMTCAVRSLTPGMVRNRRTASRKGSRSRSTSASISAMAASERIDLAQVQAQQEAMALGDRGPAARHATSRGGALTPRCDQGEQFVRVGARRRSAPGGSRGR